MSQPSQGQQINCGVNSCRFNDKAFRCTLGDIVVGNTTGRTEAKTKKETECDSFECEV